jgi:hypothetical protein
MPGNVKGKALVSYYNIRKKLTNFYAVRAKWWKRILLPDGAWKTKGGKRYCFRLPFEVRMTANNKKADQNRNQKGDD